MRCPECGAEIQTGHRYCADCGHELTAKEIESQRRASRSPAKSLIVVLGCIVLIGAVAFGGVKIFKSKGSGDDNPSRVLSESTRSTENVSINTRVPVTPTATAPAVRQTPAIAAVTATPVPGTPTPVPRTATPVPRTPTPAPVTQVSAVSNRQMSYGRNTSVTTKEDFSKLLKEMFEYGYDEVELGAFNVSDWRSVFGAFASADSILISGSTVKVEWLPGVRIIHAHKRGNVSLLSESEKKIYNEARDIIRNIIRAGMTDLEKEIAIHDYIIHNCDYDINTTYQTKSTYGFFNYGKCQCSGYVDTFYLLGTLAGLEINSVSGVVNENNGSHAWNVIKLDGRWYAVDVTYDDPEKIYASDNFEHHAYLNVPVNFFNTSRTWSSWSLPEGQYAVLLDGNWYYYSVDLITTKQQGVDSVVNQFRIGSEAYIRTNNSSIQINDLGNAIVSACYTDISWQEIMNEQGIRVVKFSKR